MTFVDFPSGLLLLFAATDDGSLHFIQPRTWLTLYSIFESFLEPIVGMAVNREKATGNRTRLMLCDCQSEAQLWDLSHVRSDSDLLPARLTKLRSWEPFAAPGTTTDCIAVDDIDVFMSSS